MASEQLESSDIRATDHNLSRSLPTFAHRQVSDFLSTAIESGKLGSGPKEYPRKASHVLLAIWQTMPWTLLVFQALWSSAVMMIAYALADKSLPRLDVMFWTSRLNVSSSVSYGVGWALFVLLGFFIREASGRFQEAHLSIATVGLHLANLLRQIRQAYPAGTWHDGDLDRIVAHLVAFPIALKMALRGEREAEQLDMILTPEDLEDVLEADSMHLHCSRVVRAYTSAAEDDAYYSFGHTKAEATPAGWGTRYFVIDVLDAVDMAANTATRISEFRPSIAYVSHLQIFLYIWMLFLPLALVASSGWYVFKSLLYSLHQKCSQSCTLNSAW